MYVEPILARELIEQFEEEFPEAEVVYRDSEGLPIKVVLFLFMYQILQFFNGNLRRYSFVVGGKYIVMPNKASYKFTEDKMTTSVYKLVRHEMVHLRQDRDNALWKLRYLLWPMPILITERGYRWEMEAYKESLRAEYDIYGYIDEDFLERIVSKFSGGTYFFMDVRTSKVRKELTDFCKELQG